MERRLILEITKLVKDWKKEDDEVKDNFDTHSLAVRLGAAKATLEIIDVYINVFEEKDAEDLEKYRKELFGDD